MLRKAIENDCEGFFLNYQPLIRGDGQSVLGAEALLRFSCPELDMPFVSPGEFIPVLEKNGMINEVGAWAIRTALKQAAEWRKIDHTFVASIGKNRMDEAIIEYLMQLCHHTNINVCVEGIETREILSIVQKYRPQLLQGYYFSKPLSTGAFADTYIGKGA